MAYKSLTFSILTTSADGQGNVVSSTNGSAGDPVTAAGTADTATGTAVTAVSSVDTHIDAAVTASPSSTAVAADVATLVADGIAPTQAHVNTLNSDWGTFLTALNAYKADVLSTQTASDTAVTDVGAAKADTAATVAALGSGDVIVTYNGSTVTLGNEFRAALRDFERKSYSIFKN